MPSTPFIGVRTSWLTTDNEIGSGFGRRLGLLLGRLQPIFGALALGNVGMDADGTAVCCMPVTNLHPSAVF